jgi:hypothetical protein
VIKIFDSAKKIIFFPVRWANLVTTWIQNICSPDDSLKVLNTCTPKEGQSLQLRVNMQKVIDSVKAYFADYWVTPTKLRETLDSSFNDGKFLRLDDGDITLEPCGAMSSATSTTNFTSAGQKLIDKGWKRGESVYEENRGTTNNPNWVVVKNANGNEQLCGVVLRSFTRTVRVADIDYHLYREWIFDKNGMLKEVSAEKAAFGAYNDAY